MTEEQIRAATGRELDVLVAEHVLGWAPGTWQGELATIDRCFSRVIPAMREKGWRFYIQDWRGTQQSDVGFGRQEKDRPLGRVINQIAPFGEEATGICRAALLALLAEEGK